MPVTNLVNVLHLEPLNRAPWILPSVRNTMREIHRVSLQPVDEGTQRTLENLRVQLNGQMQDGLQQYNELRATGEMLHRERLRAADHVSAPLPPARPPIASDMTQCLNCREVSDDGDPCPRCRREQGTLL